MIMWPNWLHGTPDKTGRTGDSWQMCISEVKSSWSFRSILTECVSAMLRDYSAYFKFFASRSHSASTQHKERNSEHYTQMPISSLVLFFLATWATSNAETKWNVVPIKQISFSFFFLWGSRNSTKCPQANRSGEKYLISVITLRKRPSYVSELNSLKAIALGIQEDNSSCRWDHKNIKTKPERGNTT